MFAAACVAICITAPLHGPRWEVLRAAARYDTLRVEPPPGAPLEVRYRAVQQAALVTYLQLVARGLWEYGLNGSHPDSDALLIMNMLQACRDIGSLAAHVDHPTGVIESYRIQAALIEKLGPVSAEVAKRSLLTEASLVFSGV